MKATILVLALALSAVATVPCRAQDRDDGRDGRYDDTDRRYRPVHEEDHDFDRNRFYVGAGPLWALSNFDDRHAIVRQGGGRTAVAETDDAGNAWGADARVGYRFHPQLAIEGQGQYYGNFSIDGRVPGATASQHVADLEGFSFTTNLKVFPITGRVQPYFLAGAGFLWARFSDARGGNEALTFAGRGGLGVDFYLDENVALNVEGTYLLPTDHLNDFQMAGITGGLQLHF